MNIYSLAKNIFYGWISAKTMSQNSHKTRLTIYIDMLKLALISNVNYNQYVEGNLCNLIGDKREQAIREFSENNKASERWQRIYDSNWKFLGKWAQQKYSGSPILRYRRAKAYQKHYHLNHIPTIQYGVQILCEHNLVGNIDIGRNVLLAKDVFVDYTGNITIKDNVQITYGCVLQTHYHPWHSDYRLEHTTVPTSLVIEEGAVVGTRAIIMASCHYIGKHARVGAGAVVTHDVPDYSIVVGTPAKVVRFQEKAE